MSLAKPQKFCQLTHAIKAFDSKFYDALDSICIFPLLRPGQNGVTFLFPADKSIREKIIKASGSESPEVAVKMVKALILRGCYKKIDDIHGVVSNALNHLIELKDGKWNGFSLSIPKNFGTFDYKGNIFMLMLNGTGEIPTSGTAAPRFEPSNMVRTRKEIVVGGGLDCGCMCWPSHKSSINNKMAKFYPNEYKDKKSNIYVKKVYAQLCILKKDHPEIYNSNKLLSHLGNEEISDSYLLDMITPDDVLCKIWKAIGQNADRLGEFGTDSVGPNDFYSKYIALKQERIKQKHSDDEIKQILNNNLKEQEQLVSRVVSPCDFRDMLVTSYHSDGGKQRLGKDLFIVFTSVMKEMWEHEYDMASYQHYVYMANNVYTSFDDMVNQEFNQFKDTTLHGNLLKSDVFKFVPCANMSIYADVYKVLVMPKPIELKIYSLNNVVNSFAKNKVGGGASILGGYFE